MNLVQLPSFRQYLDEWAGVLNSLRQNRLLDESSFIRFARERGLDTSGVCKEGPGDFFKRGWLTGDGTNFVGDPLFHPFRILPLAKILDACQLNISTSSTLNRDNFLGFIEKVLPSLPGNEQINEIAFKWNRVVDLAILLEPVYWPRITSKITFPGILREEAFNASMDQYRNNVTQLVGTLDPTEWHEIHQQMRFQAHWLDENDKLYVLLRVSNWERRESLKGDIAGALWFRHIAEVIRLAFEDVTDERWPEEDNAGGTWFEGARKSLYGAERPFDDELMAKPYLSLHFGLFTGSLVRWYVEGDTEYFAILHILRDPPKSGIEIVNLRGNFENEKSNIAIKFSDCLKEDQALRRFSMISFDVDVPKNVKTVRRQLEQNNIVGFITANRPDFEFANFTVHELAEIASRLDEQIGNSGDAIRNADWIGVTNGRDFEAKYMNVSASKPRGLKGKEWGEALAAYILEHPFFADSGKERPFWREIQAAIRARGADFDFQKERYGFNAETFELVDLERTR